MITDYKDYQQKLWEIENEIRTSQAVLLPIPPKEEIIPIDLNTREIKVPKSFIIVTQDHAAETLYFTFDRFFENMDLNNTACVIQYKNGNNEDYYYPVPYYDITTDAIHQKIIIPWVIQNSVTAYAGTVKFSMKFFKCDASGNLLYELNTLPATAIVQEGQKGNLGDISKDNIELDNTFLLMIHEIQRLYKEQVLDLEFIDNFGNE